MQSPILSTDRLSLLRILPEDAPFIFELMTSQKWITNIGNRGIKTVADAEKYIHQTFQKSYDEHGYGLYKIQLKETKQSAGICGFVKRTYLDAPDLGFALLTEYEKKGIGYEAAAAVLQYGFTELLFEKVYAITLPSNAASIALLIKLGFTEKVSIQQNGEELFRFTTRP